MLKNEKIALRYARAYLNVYQTKLLEHDNERLESLAFFLTRNRVVIAYLAVPRLSMQEKELFLTAMLTLLRISDSFINLVLVLLKQGRIELLEDVVHYVLHENQVRHGMQTFAISSSQALSHEEQQQIVQFLEHKIGSSVTAGFSIDPALIYGIKLQSESLFFDNSIAKKLKDARQELLRQVEV